MSDSDDQAFNSGGENSPVRSDDGEQGSKPTKKRLMKKSRLEEAAYGDEGENEDGGDYDTYKDLGGDGEYDDDIIDDYVDDDQADQIQYASTKKEKRKKKKKDRGERERPDKKSRKRKEKMMRDGADDEAMEDFVDGTESDAERELKKMNKKLQKKEIEKAQSETIINNLVNEMEYAYKDDLDMIELQKPALNRLKLLPKIETTLKTEGLKASFCENKGLDMMTRWLARLPNGQLPALALRKKLIDLVANFPVNGEQLKECDLGKVLKEMSLNKNEDPALKKQINDIINRWTRMLMQEYSAQDGPQNVKKLNVSLDEHRLKTLSTLRQSIPKLTMKRSGFDFSKKPPKENERTNLSQGRKIKSSSADLDKMFFDAKRKIRKELK